MKDSTVGLKDAFLWICEKIVTGVVKGVKLIPPADRRLTEWTVKLLRAMMRHKIASLVVLALVPAFSFLVLEADGILDPVSDALDVVLDILTSLPFDIMVPLILLGSVVGIGLIMYRRKVGPGQAAKIVFLAVFARVVYLTVILVLVIFLLQLTPLKSDRRNTDVIIPMKFSLLPPDGPWPLRQS